jgi:hypothetical protein
MIVEGQEIGCDLQCKRYGINPCDLASAICKSAQHLTFKHAFVHQLTEKPLTKRINILLNHQAMMNNKFIAFFALFFAFFAIFLGKFWIF